MNRFVLKNTFIKVYIYHFSINIFIKNMELKLSFEDLVVVLNDFLYMTFFTDTEGAPQLAVLTISIKITIMFQLRRATNKKKHFAINPAPDNDILRGALASINLTQIVEVRVANITTVVHIARCQS